MDRARIGMSSRYLPAMHRLLPVRGFHRTRDDMIGVTGMHDGITIAVKNDGRDDRPVFENGRSLTELGRSSESAIPHGGKCRDKIVGGSAGETRMYADCRIQIGVGCSHHGGRSGSG
jgi:hypothetical protein